MFKFILYLNKFNLYPLVNLIEKAIVFTEILPLIFYLTFKKRINDESLRVIFFMLCSGFLCDLLSLYLQTQQKENFLAFNINILIEGVSLGIFFYQILYNRRIKQLLFVIGFGLISYWLYEFLTTGDNDYLNTWVTIENICILAFALYYYYEQIVKINTTSIYSQPRFWIVTAYLIFIAGTFFLLLYLPTFSLEDRGKYYVLNNVFLILRTLLISFAMLIKNDHTSTKNNKLRVSSSLNE